MYDVQANAFPPETLDGSKKNKEWLLKYVKAAWDEYNQLSKKPFYGANDLFTVIDSYAAGKQSVEKYKSFMSTGDDNTAWVNIDYSPVSVFPKLRDMALARLNKTGYDIIATPLDPLANEELTSWYAEQKGKIRAREVMNKIAPELTPLTPLAKKEGDPTDIEELDIQYAFTKKHNMASEMEVAINFVLEQNKFDELWSSANANLFDYGAVAFRDYIAPGGAIKIRRCNLRNLFMNYCYEKDFSDMIYCGEVIPMTIEQLSYVAQDQISENEYEQIRSSAVSSPINQRTNRSRRNNLKDNLVIEVVDFELLSTNAIVYESGTDKYGNNRMPKASYNAIGDNIVRKNVKVVYKLKWVVGTNIIFDAGLCTNMKRQQGNLAEASLSFHVRAVSLNEMETTGKTELAISVIDQIQLSWIKLQQIKSEARPSGVAIEIGALEDVNLGQGGEAMRPLDILDLFYQKGTLVYRKKDLSGQDTNYRPIQELAGGIGTEAMAWFNQLQGEIAILKEMLGLNDLTDGSSPDPRTLTYVAQAAVENTNNALWPIVESGRFVLKSLSDSIIMRIHAVIEAGYDLSGYIRSIGSNSVRFFKLNPKARAYEYGIKLEVKPDAAQRQQFIQDVRSFYAEGVIDPEDLFLIQNTPNLKMAEQILAYRIKRRKEKMQQDALMMQQQNGAIQMQSAQATEAAKQQTIQIEYQLKAEIERIIAEKEITVANIRANAVVQAAGISAEGKVTSQALQNDSKERMNEVEEPEEEGMEIENT